MHSRSSLVSIIIPVYNVKPYLYEALDSVLCQSYTNLDIIVIDDGSTDGSSEICDEYAIKDDRVRVVHQENRGLSAARNIGLSLMLGDVVAFLDSDDAYHETFVETQLQIMMHEGVDIVICKYTVHRTEGQLRCTGHELTAPIAGPGVYNRISILRAVADNSLNVNVWNKLYSRKLWERLRFPEDHVYEDVYVILFILDACDTAYITDQKLYMYRRRTGSIAATLSSDNYADMLFAYSHYYAYMENHTPDVFTYSQMRTSHNSYLLLMTATYAHLCRSAENTEMLCVDLHKRIASLGDRMGTAELSFKALIAYYCVRFYPDVLVAIYPLYQYIRQLMRGMM